MPTTMLNDISMYYEIRGEGEPLVLIGGFSADHCVWNCVARKFATRYKVILFDNRGAGRTDVPLGPYSIEQMTNDVIMLCDKLNITKANFIGNSMGGYIVQMLAYRYPKYVKSAVISNSGMQTYSCFRFYVEAEQELLKGGAPLSSIIKASCCWVFSYSFLSKPENFAALVEFGLHKPYPFTQQGCEAQCAALASFDSTAWANKINVPTFIITSDQDLILSPMLSEKLVKEIPNAKYYCFQDCGHLPHIEYPELYVKVVYEFLDSLAISF